MYLCIYVYLVFHICTVCLLYMQITVVLHCTQSSLPNSILACACACIIHLHTSAFISHLHIESAYFVHAKADLRISAPTNHLPIARLHTDSLPVCRTQSHSHTLLTSSTPHISHRILRSQHMLELVHTLDHWGLDIHPGTGILYKQCGLSRRLNPQLDNEQYAPFKNLQYDERMMDHPFHINSAHFNLSTLLAITRKITTSSAVAKSKCQKGAESLCYTACGTWILVQYLK